MTHRDCPGVGRKKVPHASKLMGIPRGQVQWARTFGREGSTSAQWHVDKVAIGWSGKPVIFELVFERELPLLLQFLLPEVSFLFVLTLTLAAYLPVTPVRPWSRWGEKPKSPPARTQILPPEPRPPMQ